MEQRSYVEPFAFVLPQHDNSSLPPLEAKAQLELSEVVQKWFTLKRVLVCCQPFVDTREQALGKAFTLWLCLFEYPNHLPSSQDLQYEDWICGLYNTSPTKTAAQSTVTYQYRCYL